MMTFVQFIVTVVGDLLYLALGLVGLLFVCLGVMLALSPDAGLWTEEMVKLESAGFDSTFIIYWFFWRYGLAFIVTGGCLVLATVIRLNQPVKFSRGRRPLPPLASPAPLPLRRLPPIRRR